MAEKKLTTQGKMECMNFLRVCAIFLVLNSHFDNLYPNSLFATGGSSGNSLFFILSGFFIKYDEKFLPWIGKKLYRLYLPVFIVTLLTSRLAASPVLLLEKFIWPTDFWFIGALVIFYLLFYCLKRCGAVEHFGLLTVLMGIAYFAYYLLLVDKTQWSVEAVGLVTVGGLFKLIYYFYIFLLGYHIRTRNYTGRLSAAAYLILAAVGFVVPIGLKYLLMRNALPMYLQFVTQFINIGFAVCALLLCLRWEEAYRHILGEKLRGAVNMLSGISLEIYLVQFFVIRKCEPIMFPVNILAALAAVVLLAYILHFICGKLAIRAK